MRFEDKVAELRIKKHKGKETKEFLEDIKALANGEAYEYLLGSVDFCGAKIDLSLRPMIPRPETEFWVAIAIAKEKEVRSKEKEGKSEMATPFRLLDMFAGSGNVGLAFLKNINDCTVDFIEYDPKLKKQIEISIEKNKGSSKLVGGVLYRNSLRSYKRVASYAVLNLFMSSLGRSIKDYFFTSLLARQNKIDTARANVMVGDTFLPLSRQDLDKSRSDLDKYDVITAVPPYVPPQMKNEVMEELHAEDPLSFFDKEDGYYYHKQVLSNAKEFLNDGGTLYLEFDITQREKIEELAKEFGWTNYSFLKDPYGHEFVIKLEK